MAIEKTAYVERVLIVLNADGTLKGAHQELLEVYADAGTVVASRQLPAAPLDAATLATALPSQSALLSQVAALTPQRSDETAAGNSDGHAAVPRS